MYYYDAYDAAAFGFILVIILVVALIVIAAYLLTAIPLFKMAKTAGYPNPWFAFVPYCQQYLLCVLPKKKFTLFNGSIKLEKAESSFWIFLAISLGSGVISGILTAVGIPGTIISTIVSVALGFINFVWYRNLASTFKPESDPVTYGVLAAIIPVASVVELWMMSNQTPTYGAGMYPYTMEYDATAPQGGNAYGQPQQPYGQQAPYGQQQAPYGQQQAPYSQPQNTGYQQQQAPYSQPQATSYQQPQQTPYAQTQNTGFQQQTPYAQTQNTGFQQQAPYTQPQGTNFQPQTSYAQPQASVPTQAPVDQTQNGVQPSPYAPTDTVETTTLNGSQNTNI